MGKLARSSFVCAALLAYVLACSGPPAGGKGGPSLEGEGGAFTAQTEEPAGGRGLPGSCAPGRSLACSCTDGKRGAQLCNADGLGYGECACVGGSGGSFDDPATDDGLAAGGVGGVQGESGAGGMADDGATLFECAPTMASSCAPDEICVTQSPGALGGACYTVCTPGGEACASPAEDCVPSDLSGARGICMLHGEAKLGESCIVTLLSTGCVSGGVCVLEGGAQRCEQACDFFSNEPACSGGSRCVVDGVCIGLPGVAAGLGEVCPAGADEGSYCADDGKAWRGVCAPAEAHLRCAPLCRTGATDCGSSASTQCVPAFEDAPGVGVCADRGECGSGGEQVGDCAVCVDAAFDDCCHETAQDCAAGTTCAQLLHCLNACNESTCKDECVAKHAGGTEPLNSLIACIFGAPTEGFVGACGTVCK